MTYELERQHKERRAVFEEEIQRRLEYINLIHDINNWSYYLNSQHKKEVQNDRTTNTSEQLARRGIENI